MSQVGYTGISYPFRVGNTGGVVMSTTSSTDSTHIDEGVQQIFNTMFLERPMEPEVYSSVNELLFEPNDEVLQRVLKVRIVNDLTRIDSRIRCKESDITFSVEKDNEGVYYLYANIAYTIIKYSTQEYNAKVKVGEVINENYD